MKLLYIINPASGKLRRDTGFVDRLTAQAKRLGVAGEMKFTQHAKHATELAALGVEQGFDCVVAVGGDGTMNEVAQGLVHQDCLMGLVPCGSGNGLGRHLGIVGGVERALQILGQGAVKSIDSGSVNEHPFFNVMGIGFDAEISERFNHLESRGLSSYIKVGTQAFFSYRPRHYHVQNGTSTRVTDAWMVSVANSAQFGNNAYIAPQAQVDDGLLDLVCLCPAHPLQVLPLTFRLFAKNIHKSPRAITMQAKTFTVECEGASTIHTDGEVYQTEKILNIVNHPKSLKIIAPKSVN